ncbi:hypothetical protein [Nocardia brasiliensis]|uniref:hypothetical protein n=1 Tax=Nocardia brasiliensis TaxID=37326 RepID=UPI003D8DCD4D
MNSSGDVIAAILAALDTIDGLRPATTLGTEPPAWWPWDARGFAVDLTQTRVEIRVTAAELPLSPLLDKAGEAVRAALAGTPWSDARLRLVVTDLDAAAFGGEGRVT